MKPADDSGARSHERPITGVAPARHHPFFWLATFALVIGVFARGQEVIIPLALAVLVAFAMTPAVIALERKLGRGLAVAIVVLAGLAAVGSVGFLLKRQLTERGTGGAVARAGSDGAQPRPAGGPE
jgi:predicted PurR-regulated permease PerM